MHYPYGVLGYTLLNRYLMFCVFACVIVDLIEICASFGCNITKQWGVDHVYGLGYKKPATK